MTPFNLVAGCHIQAEIEVTRRRGRGRKKLLDEFKDMRILSFERGSSRSHCVEEPFWKRRLTCHQTEY
jgi:hypothetical protein